MRTYKELLLCIPVLAMLLFLFTAAAPRKDAKQALCADNLRKILNLMQSYADTHGVMPPVWVQEKPLWRFWHNFLDPYFNSRTFAVTGSSVLTGLSGFFSSECPSICQTGEKKKQSKKKKFQV